MNKLCIKVWWLPLPFLCSAVLVTAGPSGGEKGEIGVGKFRTKSETTTAGKLLSTVFGSGLV